MAFFHIAYAPIDKDLPRRRLLVLVLVFDLVLELFPSRLQNGVIRPMVDNSAVTLSNPATGDKIRVSTSRAEITALDGTKPAESWDWTYLANGYNVRSSFPDVAVIPHSSAIIPGVSR